MNQELRIPTSLKLRGASMNKERLKAIIHNSLFMIHSKGFTLVELLIVIAILGILGGGIIAAINPLAKINSANLAKAKTFAASVENNLAIDQVGKWSFEDGVDATSFKDTSGYNTSGSCSGGTCPTWTSAATCGLGFEGCLRFDGSDDYVNVEDRDSLSPNQISVFGWIKLNSLPSAGTSYYLLRKAEEYYVEIYPSSYAIYVRNQAGSQGVASGGIPEKDKWIHFGFTWNNNQIKLYINGQEINSGLLPGNSVQNTVNLLQIGVGYNDSFDGLIDEVQIYSQALLSSQIQQLYAQGLPKHRYLSIRY